MKILVPLLLSLLMIVWLSLSLVRVENQRYAMSIGMCWSESLKMPDPVCVVRAETRTAWYWHLYYALRG
jgi:hypothetical protein